MMLMVVGGRKKFEERNRSKLDQYILYVSMKLSLNN